MSTNSKKDHSISFDELTGGVPVPPSPEPTRLSQSSTVHASPSTASTVENVSVVEQSPVVEPALSPEPVATHFGADQPSSTSSQSAPEATVEQRVFTPTVQHPATNEVAETARHASQPAINQAVELAPADRTTDQAVEPIVVASADEPIKLNDELIANRTYRVEPGKLFGNMTDHASQTERIDRLLEESRDHAKATKQAFAPTEEHPTPAIDYSPQTHAKPSNAPKIDLQPVLDEKTGFKDSAGRLAITWWSRFAKLTHLKQLLTSSRWRYIGVGLGSFLVFYLIFNYQLIVAQLGYMINQPKQVATLTQPATSPIVANSANATSATPAEIVPPDNLIVIPKINVNAPVVLEPSLAEKNIQRSLQDGVVHYAGTALPGEPGNVAIVGHSSNDWWEPGNYKFVFALLEKMAVGDKIQINYNSHKYVYEVSSTKVVEPTDLSVLAPTAEPTLTLITCTPPGTSWKRLIVSARQIEPVPASAPSAQLAKANATVTPAPATVPALPGNSPGFLSQIGDFFSKIWSFFFHKPTDSTSPATQAKPAQHLPQLD